MSKRDSKAGDQHPQEVLAQDLEDHRDEDDKEPKYSFKKLITTLLPIILWLPDYKNDWKTKLPGDIRAGITIGVMLVPQGLAYALLAGLPVQYGLFSALMPPLIYGFTGTSRQLSVAPVAVVSLLTATGISTLYDPETELDNYVGAAIALALVLGIVQLAMGILRLGFVINFLSHSVLSGFTSASGLVIGLSQLKHVLGIPSERSSHVHEVLKYTFQNIKETNWRTVLISLGTMAILLIWKYPPSHKKMQWFKKYFKPFPSAMLVVIIFTSMAYKLDLTEHGVKVVGDVPAGLPKPIVPSLSIFGDLIVLSLTIAMVGFMESMVIAKKYADENKYRLNYNQELIALGAANIAGSFFQCYPTTGGFSRTAVNANAGAKTQLAGIIGVVVIIIAVAFATDLFFYLPNAVLGSIVIIAVAPLFDVMEPIRLWKISKMDSILLVVTFCLTAFIGVEIGVGISIGLALLLVVYQASRPHYAIEGRLGNTEIYRNIKRFPDATVPENVAIYRFDAEIFFANTIFFEKKLKKRCVKPGIDHIVLDFVAVSRVDVAGIHMLEALLEDMEAENITLYFAAMKGPVRDLFEKAGLIEHVGADHFFKTVHAAVTAATGGVVKNLDAEEDYKTDDADKQPPSAQPYAAVEVTTFPVQNAGPSTIIVV
eukprot:m.23628 g.23628  ORF g.23628 m.23628 type:complete len:655 (-) comp8521_c0_seq2:452-2416(-)